MSDKPQPRTGHQPEKPQGIPLDSLRPELADSICADHPEIRAQGFVPPKLAREYRARAIEALLRDQLGELSALDAEVVQAISTGMRLNAMIEDDLDGKRSFGERAADAIAAFGGSWTFILLFAAFLVSWMTLARLMGKESFDPYPFILLNLVLSTLAAIQAPVIMMSQNRQEEKDRKRARNDYQVNLKAELEIRLLHDRLEWLIERLSRDVKTVASEIEADKAAIASPDPDLPKRHIEP